MDASRKTNFAIAGMYLILLLAYFIPYFSGWGPMMPFLSPFRVIIGLFIGGVVFEIFKEYRTALSEILIILAFLYALCSCFGTLIISGADFSFFNVLIMALVMYIISLGVFFLSMLIELIVFSFQL